MFREFRRSLYITLAKYLEQENVVVFCLFLFSSSRFFLSSILEISWDLQLMLVGRADVPREHCGPVVSALSPTAL